MRTRNTGDSRNIEYRAEGRAQPTNLASNASAERFQEPNCCWRIIPLHKLGRALESAWICADRETLWLFIAYEFRRGCRSVAVLRAACMTYSGLRNDLLSTCR